MISIYSWKLKTKITVSCCGFFGDLSWNSKFQGIFFFPTKIPTRIKKVTFCRQIKSKTRTLRKTQMRKCKENQKILKLGLRGEERRGTRRRKRGNCNRRDWSIKPALRHKIHQKLLSQFYFNWRLLLLCWWKRKSCPSTSSLHTTHTPWPSPTFKPFANLSSLLVV